MNIQDKTGQRFGQLIAQSLAGGRKRGYAQWLCVCDCGNTCVVSSGYLRRNDGTTSCGRCANKSEHLPNGVTVLTLEHRDGTTLPCFIDTVDYPLVQQHRWSATRDLRTTYANTTVRGTKQRLVMHQLLGGKGCDHKDGNGLNNRRSNLRPAQGPENARNRRKIIGTASLYKGVYFQRKKVSAHIYIFAHIYIKKGNRLFLGSFDSEVEAAQAYDAAARKYFGEFAALNFPQPGEQGAGVRLDDGEE